MVGLLLAGCGDSASRVETQESPIGGITGGSAPRPTDRPEPPTEPEQAPSASGECKVSDGPTGPIFDPELQAAFGELQPGQADFDWNGDGRGDALRFESSGESVAVDYGDGSFEVTGVPSDFSDVLYDLPGAEMEVAGPAGPPSVEAFRQGRAGPTPATVGDFTRDGRPDLAVFIRGELIVHVSSAQDSTETASRHYSDGGSTAASWSSPRESTDLPFDEATVVAVGDINGDGVGDLRVDSYAPRAFVSPAFYLGKPCE